MFSFAVIAASISLLSFAPKTKNADVVNFKVTAQKSKVDFTGSKKVITIQVISLSNLAQFK